MLVIISGVSGSGKDTVIKELINKMEKVETIPSFTSRPQRADDVPGGTYFFVSKEQFEERIKNNEFYEYDIHHNHYYGTSKKVLREKIDQGKIVVKDIEVNGTENLIKVLKDDIKVVTIFLRVDKEELKKRLKNRIDKLPEEQIKLRLDRFDYEESKTGIYDYVIKNKDLEKTVQVIMSIIDAEYNNN